MHYKKVSQNGFALIEGIIIIGILGVIGFIGWKVLGNKSTPQTDSTNPPIAVTTHEEVMTHETKELIWQQGEGGWRSMQTPPDCPAQPIMKSPVDISKVTAILYPGQTRGGNYKPHGGFRLDGTKNDKVTVAAPIDGYIVRGGNYLSEGEIQYTFDIMNNCGVMYRVGHFRALPEKLQKIANTWPSPKEGDSRTESVNPAVFVERGETLATSVGIVATSNTFFDWGVYDYRQTNEASKSPNYQQAHAQDKELSWHAVCWFDWLPTADTAKIKTLPAGDPGSGKKSDYCK